MIGAKHVVGAVVGLNIVGGMSSALAAPPAGVDAFAQELWSESIVRNPSNEEGCFEASYPSMTWQKVACVEGPGRAFVPRRGVVPETVGNGNDFAAKISTGLISRSVGSFPTVTGVTSETDGGANNYSIQLNSNFMSGTAACNGVSGCLSWLQYVYSSSTHSAFMQYWLIGIGKCPAGQGWNNAGSGDCYKNSAAVSVPKIGITQLSHLKMSGTAVKGGTDTLVFSHGTKAYKTTGADTVADLATAWTASEFNIIGDGGGSSAVFNSGSSVTVKIALTDGTTGETNNLNLGSCSATGGTSPFIEFTEKN